ncbi:MAG TPA: UDP-N-acetylmuramoyl-tripeptide--D-alanyl-D-alanine ligase [Calditrichia bacterium]|nr:UDP-N-acetylmuramoyl-tripeptide--D-alanyl-D-alanine ligase [Calditrichota bacterium]HQU70992.1 UDP-N-acetylmuramoyl-tripeptide--D-alanyl-D-alanine ligase [Calditrichia bacterium]HQV30434.1 UDP-N-acetylmuramoyl-tripeptide--D-alanyl-D-alanine ligase [Calditrichia bacterium]
MEKSKPENLYRDEISLLANEEISEYIRLNLRKIISHREKFDIPVIGIAGTEGKTTTKRMLMAILGGDKAVLETAPNCSTAWGVTSTLLKMNAGHRAAILEMGIANPQQFKLAVEVARPTIGVITNIGEAHLASQGDKYIIADAKLELVQGLDKDGVAVLNIDDDLVAGMARFSPTPRVLKFGFNKNAHFFASNIRYLGPDGIAFDVNDFYRLHLPIYGSTAIYNALTAIAVARVLGISFEDIRLGLEKNFSLISHSGNLVRGQNFNLLDYSYDATINSVTRACESLTQFRPFSRKLVLVIGDISNPGPSPKETHQKLGYYIAAMPIDAVVTIGEYAREIAEGIRRLNHTHKELCCCQNQDELFRSLQGYLGDGATLLVIGSKKQKLHELVGRLCPEVS